MEEVFRLVDEKEKTVFIDQLGEIDWIYWLNRPYFVFIATFFWAGARKRVFERTGFEGLEPGNHLYQYPDLYYDKKFQEKGVIYFGEYFKSHKMSDLSEGLDRMHVHHITALRGILTDTEGSVSGKIARASDLIQDYVPYLWMITQIEAYFNKIIALEVPKYIDGDYSKFVGDMSMPRKRNEYTLMLDAINQGVSFGEIVRQYGWLKSRDGFSDFYTEADIEEIRLGAKEMKPYEVDIPERLLELSEDLRELSYFRTSRTDKFFEYLGVARPLFLEVADSMGVSFQELAYYDANSVAIGEFRKYDQLFSYGLLGDQYFISNKKLLNFFEHQDEAVSGRVAFRGSVRGIVRIVMHPDDISRVEKGDILVAQMTFPAYISAMQKAAAFVTDEGSITCHAAIISREMKKPCIVGTKNATKVLKDGDMIEVDANNGVVRIIKKSN